MQISNIDQVTAWFEVFQTTQKCQTAVMRLNPGQATGEQAESHEVSEQILFLVEGFLDGEIGSDRLALDGGDVVIIPAGVKHRFKNSGDAVAVTFNVYTPPQYP